MLNLLKVALVALFCMSVQANSQDYPEYQGVYIWDSALQTWVELRPINPVIVPMYRNMRTMTGNRFQLRGDTLWMLQGVSQREFERAPIIDVSKELRILVKSRNPDLLFVSALIDLQSFAQTVPQDTEWLNSNFPGDVADYAEPVAGFNSGLGFVENAFKVKFIDATTSEFVMSGVPVDYSVMGAADCAACFLPATGLLVFSGEQFHVFTTPEMYELYSNVNSH